VSGFSALGERNLTHQGRGATAGAVVRPATVEQQSLHSNKGIAAFLVWGRGTCASRDLQGAGCFLHRPHPLNPMHSRSTVARDHQQNGEQLISLLSVATPTAARGAGHSVRKWQSTSKDASAQPDRYTQGPEGRRSEEHESYARRTPEHLSPHNSAHKSRGLRLYRKF